MAHIPFPSCTVTNFRWRWDDAGTVVYEAAYGPSDFIVGPGWRRLAGSLTLTAGDLAEEGELETFIALALGDDNSTDIPWDREVEGPGAFPFGTEFQAGAASDSAAEWNGLETSDVVLNYKLPTDATAADIDLAKGSKLTIQNTFATVLVAPADPGATRSTVTVFPRVTAGAASVSEVSVKARVLASQSLLERSGSGFLQPITLAWRQVP